jgi:hypothetical protein
MRILNGAVLALTLVLALALLACGSDEEGGAEPTPRETEPTAQQTAEVSPTVGAQQTAEAPQTAEGIPLYPESVLDSEKCGEGAYYVDGKEPSVLSKEYCEMLVEQGWELVGGEQCSGSTAGGTFYEKDGRRLLVTHVGYEQVNTCYYPRYSEE